MASNKGKFCVIGPQCGRVTGQHDRKWFDSEDDAVDHAKSLMSGRQPGSTPALVVEVKQVVEIAGPPVTVRRPRETDFPY